MKKQAYIAARARTDVKEVTYGWMTVRLLEADELDEAQIGYSVNFEGKDLTGSGDGDWRPDWLVVGEEDWIGDPIFVDLSVSDLPVYTAPHGEGRWDPALLASSFESFVEALGLVDGVSDGRSFPTALDESPLPEQEKQAILVRIATASPNADLSFWSDWLVPPE